LFRLVELGCSDIGMSASASPFRRLFYAVLQSISSGRKLLVTTAHYTW